MTDFFSMMSLPFLACLLLTGIHAYLGLHVIERKVIFVDLALAQIAALGVAAAVLFGFELDGNAAYLFSLSATLIGAALFSLTRTRKEKVPQEAVIGIVYVVAAALSVLILSRSPHGDEEIRHMLVGNILLVDRQEIIKLALLYSVIGGMHWMWRKKFLLISRQPEEAYRQKISVRGWDLLFYATFGVVVTSSVAIAGVLLVFSFLIVPAAAAVLFFDDIRSRLFMGWLVGLVTCLAGITISYFWDLPTGATIICAFGAALSLLAALRAFLYNSR